MCKFSRIKDTDFFVKKEYLFESVLRLRRSIILHTIAHQFQMVSSQVMKISPIDHATEDEIKWLTCSRLSIVVVGASGDLAKKKTYPSLLDLYDGMLKLFNPIQKRMRTR
jgi:Glucose-6-phosphate dehydrogenase, NAD binding domain